MTEYASHPAEEPESTTSTSERRRATRHALDSQVRVVIDTSELKGVANNLSQTGILFFTEGELRVHVDVDQDGETKTYSGNLVRCERIKGEHRGWAVEFDND